MDEQNDWDDEEENLECDQVQDEVAVNEEYEDGEGMEDEEDILDAGMNAGNEANNTMTDPDGVLLMKFCPHDSSMLYPKEDKRNRKLLYACRLCRYSEEAKHSIIYKNLLKQEVGNVLNKVPAAVSDDPTLPRSQKASCENCGHNEAVFFQSDTSDSRNDTLALVFVCCNCDYKWVG